MKRNSFVENSEAQDEMENMQKQILQLNLKLSQFEEQLSIQGSHQKKIISQNDEYVQQYMQIQETIERLKNIFRNEQGEEITINLQTYLQQKVVGCVLDELKFNQVISQIDNKQREQIHKLNVKTEQFKEKQDSLIYQIESIQTDIKNNTALIHQNTLFKDQMERIKTGQERTERMIQDSLDKFWKYDQQIQQLSSQISQKVEQHQVQDIQQQLKDNFVGIYHYQSQFEMLLGKVNSKTDQTYFEEKFNYIDKVEALKSEQIILNAAIKQSANDCLQKIQLFDQVLQKQASDLLKKIELKPSQVELKLIESRMDQKLLEHQQRVQENHQKVLAYFKEMEAKTQKEEEGLQQLQVQLSGVVTFEALQQKWTYIESLKEESVRIKQDQEAFRKSFKNIEDRLAVKISKFEIDQLKNAIDSEYVKINFFDRSIQESKDLIKNSEANIVNQLKNRDVLIDKVKVEQAQIIEKSKQFIKEFKEEIEEKQLKIQKEQEIQKVHLETCKMLAQKVDESLIYKASKIDLNEFITFCKSTYLDREQISKFVGQRDEFIQMKKTESALNQFYQEYKLWIDTFNKRMCFSFDKMIEAPIQFQWVEEIKDKINQINEMKQMISQKAEHSDLIRLFSQKANKNLVNNLLQTCKTFKKQLIYEIVSIQSFIKCMQSRQDLLPSQQLAVQMNLRQLTKLLKWISFSSVEADQENIQDAQLKLDVTVSSFLQMEKVSDSITSKFKLFHKKLEEMGEAKFITSENKILDEYLSMIMQDPAHEEIYGNKQKSQMADLIGKSDQEIAPIKAVANQTIMRPFKIRKQKGSSLMANTVDNFFQCKEKIQNNKEIDPNEQHFQKITTLQTQHNSLQNQYTRETSSFYDPLSQFSTSQKNSPLQQGSANQLLPNDSMESLKQSSFYIKQDNKTITVGGSVYEINDLESFNKNLNDLSQNSNKSFQMNQYINLAIHNNNNNNNNNTPSTQMSTKTEASRFQQFYKNQYKKNKNIQSSQKNHHSASQSPSSANSGSSISRNQFMSPNVIKKMSKNSDLIEQTY